MGRRCFCRTIRRSWKGIYCSSFRYRIVNPTFLSSISIQVTQQPSHRIWFAFCHIKFLSRSTAAPQISNRDENKIRETYVCSRFISSHDQKAGWRVRKRRISISGFVMPTWKLNCSVTVRLLLICYVLDFSWIERGFFHF